MKKLFVLTLCALTLSTGAFASIQCEKEYVIDIKTKHVTGNQIGHAIHVVNWVGGLPIKSVGSFPDLKPGETRQGDINLEDYDGFKMRIIVNAKGLGRLSDKDGALKAVKASLGEQVKISCKR